MKILSYHRCGLPHWKFSWLITYASSNPAGSNLGKKKSWPCYRARASCTVTDSWGWANHPTPRAVLWCALTRACRVRCMPCFYKYTMTHINYTWKRWCHLGCPFTIIQCSILCCDVSLHIHAVSEFCKIILSSYNCLVYASTNHSDSSITQRTCNFCIPTSLQQQNEEFIKKVPEQTFSWHWRR